MRQVFLPAKIEQQARRTSQAGHEIVEFHGQTMGTTWSGRLVVESSRRQVMQAGAEIVNRIQDELDTIVEQMSTWTTSSSITRFNNAPAGTWQALEDEFLHVVAAAFDVARESDGAYDPTIGAAVDVWGFGPSPATAREPAGEQVEKARSSCGWRRVELDRANKRIRQPGGAYLDLSSIAKGFGVDQAARRLLADGYRNFLVEVGGELRGEGLKPDGSPWWVELELPPEMAGGRIPQAFVGLHGMSVATSGDYRRRITGSDGAAYSHTLSPQTGRPVDNGLAAVSVVAADCMTADAVSTALMVLGPEAGLAYCVRHRVAARFVVRKPVGLEQFLSPAMFAMLA